MKPEKAPLIGLSILATAAILYAGNVAARQFGYLHEANALNTVNVPVEFPGGSTATRHWTALMHGALQSQPDWAVFATPLLGRGSNAVSTWQFSDLAHVDYLVTYSTASSSWLIARQQVAYMGANYPHGYPVNVTGAFGVGVVDRTDRSIITMDNVGPEFRVFPNHLISHPGLDYNPLAVPVLSYRGSHALAGENMDFCGQLDYDLNLSQWYVTSLCSTSAATGWKPVDITIHMATPGVDGFRHTVTVGNRWTGTSCPDRAECSVIDNSLVNGEGDAILIGTRGHDANSSNIGFKYDRETQRWLLLCLPESVDGAPPADGQCSLNNNAEYHIWVASAMQETTAITTTLDALPIPSFAIAIPPLSVPARPESMQQMLSTSVNGTAVTGGTTYLSYGAGSGWSLFSTHGSFVPSFEAGSKYSIHAFPSQQNASLHKTQTFTWLSILDHPLLSGSFRDTVFVTQQVLNPFGLANGSTTLYNTGLYWDGGNWNIAAEDPFASMPFSGGVYFHVLFPEYREMGARNPRAFQHTVTENGTNSSCVLVNNPWLNNQPDARLFINHVIRDATSAGQLFINSPLHTRYYGTRSSGFWTICRSDGNSMPVGAKFNVIVGDSLIADRLFSDGFEP